MPTSAEDESISTLLKETRTFDPPAELRKSAWACDPAVYEKAAKDPEGYWANWARELEWSRPWTKVLEWNPPYAKWFIGGKINASVNCLDRHLKTDRRTKTAILWEGEDGTERTFTYEDMYREVNKFANALKSLGVAKGDRVAVYMPMIPELVVTVLACARIGAVHSVVFGGFSAESLKDRINDAEAKVLVTADGGLRRGQVVPLKQASDDAVKDTPSIEKMVVVKRTGSPVEMKAGRDVWYEDIMKDAAPYCAPEEMDAEDILFTLYTSGTTGKPKGIVHTTGGYLTGTYATSKWVFDLKDADVFWCTADVGWITGHSYIVYGPMANGVTQVIYEGAPNWPDNGRFWKIVEKYGVTIFYTAPTAIRAFMKWGTEWTKKADLSSLRLLGSVGEPINPEAWMWYHKHIGRGRCPIVDTWWQTETGAIMITPLAGMTKLKPGSATRPFPGIAAELVDEKGNTKEEGGGYVAIRKPWPSMLRGIYKDPDRYQQTYWSRWKNTYFPGDGVKKDEDGYFWFLGRVDDVLNVSGHRIGTAEVESALVDHPLVAEAAVVGRPHEIKGVAIVAFVTLKEEAKKAAPDRKKLEAEIREHCAKKIGAIAKPEEIIFSSDLPKTRSGKIMRRLVRDIAMGKVLGDTTALADPAVIEELKQKYTKGMVC